MLLNCNLTIQYEGSDQVNEAAQEEPGADDESPAPDAEAPSHNDTSSVNQVLEATPTEAPAVDFNDFDAYDYASPEFDASSGLAPPESPRSPIIEPSEDVAPSEHAVE